MVEVRFPRGGVYNVRSVDPNKRLNVGLMAGIPLLVCGLGVVALALFADDKHAVTGFWVMCGGGALALLGLGVTFWGLFPSAVESLQGRRKRREERERAIEIALEAAQEALREESVLERSERAERIRDPWGGTILWDFEPTEFGLRLEFWSYDRPRFVSLLFGFVARVERLELDVGGERLMPTPDSQDPTKVVVRLTHLKLQSASVAKLRVFATTACPIREKPSGVWYYP
jgi:hypothetical protein